jgi:hypothetical protein
MTDQARRQERESSSVVGAAGAMVESMRAIESTHNPGRAATVLGCRVLLGLTALALGDLSPSRATEGVMSYGSPLVPGRDRTVLTDGIRVISTPSEYGYIDGNGKALPLPKADMVKLCRFQEGLAAMQIALLGEREWGPQHWGFINEKGELAISPKFQYADDFHEGLAGVNVGGKPYGGADPSFAIPLIDRDGRHFIHPIRGGKWGFIDKRGQFVIKAIYEEVSRFSEGLAFASTGKELGYINKSGQMVVKVPTEYDGGDFSEGLACFSEPSRIGFVDAAGKRHYAHTVTDESGRRRIRLPSSSEGTSSDEWTPFVERGKWGYVDTAGKQAISARFFDACEFSCGRAQVSLSEESKAGYIDRSGNVVIEPQFDRASRFSEGLAAVQLGGKVGFIDVSGKMIIPARFEMAFDFSEGLAPVRTGNQWGYIDKTGKTLVAPRFLGAGLFRNGIARVATAGISSGRGDRVSYGTWGYIDRSGKFAIPPQFDEALDFWEGKAVVTKCVKYGLADERGKVIVAPSYDEIGFFSEGLVGVRQKGRCGFIDPFTGRVVIGLRFEVVDTFSCGRAAVREDHKWGFIDKVGNYVVKPQYLLVSGFSEGLAAVAVPIGSGPDAHSRWGYVDTTGKMVVQPKFILAGNFSEGLAAVSQGDEEDELWGYIDRTGKFAIEPQFADAGEFANGRAKVVRGDKEYEVDRTGKLHKVKNE